MRQRATDKCAFRIDSKSWFLTWPQCNLSKEDCLEQLQQKKKILGAVVCRELHEDGNPHLHAYVLLPKRFNCRDPRFWDLGPFHGKYEKARNIDHCSKYIKKDGDYIEFGEITWAEKVDSRREHRRYLGQKIIDGTPLPELVREDPSLLFGLSNLQKDVTTWIQMSLVPKDSEDVRGIWIHGPSGVGKSRYVRAREPSLYNKAQNKWWCSYIGQKAVLIDDFDKQGTCLSHYLKIWADRYACTGEIKGGQIPLVYERLYITSNYSIDDLFPAHEDEYLNDAIKRRFKVHHMLDKSLGLTKVRSRSFD